MKSMKSLIDEHIVSSAHLAKKHVHPKLMKMMEMGGMASVFKRGEGQYLYDLQDNRFLDLLAGGGIHFVGRNHPRVNQALRDVLSEDLPNICVVNASILGGLLAERLFALAGDHVGKAVYANSGSEATEVALRFARYVTRRRRYLYLDGAFHGRTWGAISVNGWAAMKDGMDPMLPQCTPIPANDLGVLRRELSRGDVAGFIFEPVQGMTLTALDPGYLREAELLCREHGTVLIADEIQTGFGRCGAWFVSTDYGVKPDIITVSKTLSGGQVPISAALVSNDLYDRVYDKFTSGPFYYSTFAENNLAMAASLATLDILQELDAPSRALELSRMFRSRIEELAQKHDVIDGVMGKGLMIGVLFKESRHLALRVQQNVMKAADPSSFSAAVNVDLYTRRRVIVQVPGPGLNAIKILPPVTCTESDVDWFAQALDDTLDSFYKTGPVVSLGQAAIKDSFKTIKEGIPSLRPKKKSLEARPGLMELPDYDGPVDEECDYLVVGSGPGGALVARHLAETGKRAIMVDEGPVARATDFKPEAGYTMAHYFYLGGMRMSRGNTYMPTIQCRVLGGGSVFNSAICLPPAEFALERWERHNGVEGFTGGGLDPYVDAAWKFMGVRSTASHLRGPRDDLFKKGADALGWSSEPIARNEDGCVGSGECITGCRHGGKLSTDKRGTPEFLDHGGRVLTSLRIDRLLLDGRKVVGATGWVTDPFTGKKLYKARIRAGTVVLAAGAIGSPFIAQRSGLRHKPIGDHLGFHPGSAIMAEFEQQVLPWGGASQGYHSLQFLEQGIKLETLWGTPELMAFRLPGSGHPLKEMLSRLGHMAVWDTWVSGQDSHGRVQALPGGGLDITYNIAKADVRRMAEAMAKLCEMAFAAGAVAAISGVHGLPARLTNPDDINIFRRTDFSINAFPTASNHVFGGMCMGADPRIHACDNNAAVYGVQGLYVSDTSLFPESPGVNPMFPAMVLAERLGRHLKSLT